MAGSRSFSVQAMIRGYHIYKAIWEAAIDGEVLLCEREVSQYVCSGCEERRGYRSALPTKDFFIVFNFY